MAADDRPRGAARRPIIAAVRIERTEREERAR
jgi:hypothetical protein